MNKLLLEQMILEELMLETDKKTPKVGDRLEIAQDFGPFKKGKIYTVDEVKEEEEEDGTIESYLFFDEFDYALGIHDQVAVWSEIKDIANYATEPAGEASTKPAGDEHKSKARRIFGNLVDDDDAYTAIKQLFKTADSLGKADEEAKKQVAALAGNTNKVEIADIASLETKATNGGDSIVVDYTSLDDLLAHAASSSAPADDTPISGGVKGLVIEVLSDQIGDIAAEALEDQVFNKIDKFLLAATAAGAASGAATAGTGWVAAIASAATRVAIGSTGKAAAKLAIKTVVSSLVEKLFSSIDALEAADDLITEALGSHKVGVLAKIGTGDTSAAKQIIEANAMDIFKNLITMAARGRFGEDVKQMIKTTLGFEIEIPGTEYKIPIGPFLTEFIIGDPGLIDAIKTDDTDEVNNIINSAPPEEPAEEPSGEPAEEPVEPGRFVPTDAVNTQIERMKEFYDQPYLYLQGEILRSMIKELQNAMKEEETTAGIASDTERLEEEKKGLNVKNIKASLNAFLQQSRKVKKALEEYIKMAKQGKMGATRKKQILDKEVDRLIDYGKSIIKSLPKVTSEATEATEATEEATSEEGTNLQPLHDFVNFVLGEGSFDAIQKEEVQVEINNVKPVLKVFPNVAPFGQAQDLDIELDNYSTEFQNAMNDNLKTAIANFKSLQSGEGGETAIEGLRTALIQFLGTGLAILGKSVDGSDLEELGTDEALSAEDDTASTSPSSAESIMSELGLDVGEQGEIQTTSDEEEAAEKLDTILNKLGTNKKYNTAKEISDFIYDQVKYERLSLGSWGEEGIKGILRFMGLRKFISEAKEGEFDIEDFTQKFFTKIITMSTDYVSSKDKNKLRQASNELARASEQALRQYQKLSKTDPYNPSRKITNTRKTITDMFGEMRNTTSGYGEPTDALEMKYKKVFKHMQKNINRLDFAAFINILFKMIPELVQDYGPLFAIAKDISSKIIERDKPVIKETEADITSSQKIISFEGLAESGEIRLVVPDGSGGDSTNSYYLEADYLEQGLKIEKTSSETTSEQIERKLETIIESYINNRKKQWRKRIM